jgi:hypothetical protein
VKPEACIPTGSIKQQVSEVRSSMIIIDVGSDVVLHVVDGHCLAPL